MYVCCYVTLYHNDIWTLYKERNCKSGANGLAAASWLSGLPRMALQEGPSTSVPVTPFRRLSHVLGFDIFSFSFIFCYFLIIILSHLKGYGETIISSCK